MLGYHTWGARLGVFCLALILGGSAALREPASSAHEGEEPGILTASLVWVRQFGTTGMDGAYAVALGPGGLYVAGYTEGSLEGQPWAGATDAFLRKYDLDGNAIWTRQFGNATSDSARAVATDREYGIYVAGGIGGDAFVRKFNPSGNGSWVHEFGAPSKPDMAMGVTVDGDDLFVVGWTDGGLDSGYPGLGGRDAFARRLDASIVCCPILTTIIGSSEDDWAAALAAEAGAFYLGGGTEGRLFDGPNNGSLTDGILFRYNENVSYGWSDQFLFTDGPGLARNESVNGISVSAGNVYVVGGTERDYRSDAFAKMYRENGTAVWSERFNASEHDTATGVHADATGAYVTGLTEGAYPGETRVGIIDAFVRHYDATGNALWTRQFGTSEADFAWAITGDGSDLYVAGETMGVFPGETDGPLTDAFVAKLRIEAENRPPVPTAGGPYVGTEGSAVTFDGSGSTDPDGDALTYRWDFTADGTWDTAWSSSPTASFTFPDDFSGKARLEVSDGTLNATAETSVLIQNVAPSVDAGAANAASEGSPLSFSFVFSDPGFDAPAMGTSEDFTARVDWGYGPPETVPVVELPGKAGVATTGFVNATHTYGDDGVFTVTVQVCDDDGGCGTDTTTATIGNVAPSIAFTVIPTDGDEGGSLAFQARATDPGSDDIVVSWTGVCAGWSLPTVHPNDPSRYPDPDPSPEVNPRDVTDSQTVVCGDNGVFDWRLMVGDDDGGGTILSGTFPVGNLPPYLTVSPPAQVAVDEGTLVTLGATAEDPGSDDLGFTWSWQYGPTETNVYYNDGVGPDPPDSPDGTYPFTASDASAFTYGDDGAYAVTLEVHDDDGGSLTYTTTIQVSNVPPTVDAGADAAADEGSSVFFTFTFSDPGFDQPAAGTVEDFTVTVDWGYGPPESVPVSEIPGSPGVPTTGTVSVGHTYGDNGAFAVTVTVCDDDAGCGSDSIVVTVRNVDPMIDDVQVYVLADVRLRVAGEKWHDVRVDLVWNGDVTGRASVTRYPGSPGDQSVLIEGARLQLRGDFRVTLTYTPADDPVNGQPNGATPAWVVLTMPDRSEAWFQHTFNVLHPDTWTWTIDDVRPYLVGKEITFEVTASDVGSDDLTVAWDFGDGGTATRTYYNDGIGPDPFPSPELNPITATDAATHAYAAAGSYTITLTVTDDDGGIAAVTFTLAVGP